MRDIGFWGYAYVNVQQPQLQLLSWLYLFADNEITKKKPKKKCTVNGKIKHKTDKFIEISNLWVKRLI